VQFSFIRALEMTPTSASALPRKIAAFGQFLI
jgi:hypothetical protein